MHWEAVHHAISNRDIVELGTLLSSRKRPVWNDYIKSNVESGTLPFLHMAASVDDTEKATAMMKILLKSGMDVNVLDSDGKTALMAILETPMDGLLDRALLLLDHSIDLNICDKDNDTAFFVAWKRRISANEDDNERTVILSTLIERMLGKDIDLSARDSSGRTPLMLICADETFADSSQLKSILERILTHIDEPERHSCLNSLDDEGKSVLMYAVDRMKPADVVLKLLDLSANPFEGDPSGSKLFFGLINDDPKTPSIVTLISSEDEDKTVEVITKLVELGCDPSAVNDSGGNAFHVLAQNSRYHDLEKKVKPLVACLTKLGVDIFATDKLGKTPLMLACVRRRYCSPSKLVDVFLNNVNESERTAYVNAMDLDGKSTLMYAVYSYEPGAIVLRLLKLSANPFVGKDPTGSGLFLDLLHLAFHGSAYHPIPDEEDEEAAPYDGDSECDDVWDTATAENQVDSVEAIYKLVELGCDPKAFEMTWHGTPFHILATSRIFYKTTETLFPLMKSLTDWGVDICARDAKGRTALMEVCSNCFYRDTASLVDIFLSRVDESKRTEYINVLDNEGWSALRHAVDCMQPGIVACGLLDLSASPFVGADPTGSRLFLRLILNVLHNFRRRESSLENIDAIYKLARLGFHIRCRTESGGTLLHIVAKELSWTTSVPDLKAVFECIIHAGVDKRAEDNFGRTPLMLACASVRFDKFADIDGFVIDLEANVDDRTAFVNKVDHDGKSALQYAMENRDPTGIVVRLLELSADPFIGDPSGSKLLLGLLGKCEDCTCDKSVSAVTKLLDMGCNPNFPDEGGQTALHILALRPRSTPYDLELLSLLLNRGADPTIRDKEGNIALNYASGKPTADPNFVFMLLQRMTGQGEWSY